MAGEGMGGGVYGFSWSGRPGSLYGPRTAVPGAGEAGLGSYQALLRPDEGPVLAIHLVIEAAGIA